MDQITQTKMSLRAQQWSELIAEYQSSNMTVVAWCELNNVKIKSYYYWLRKLRKLAIENASTSENQIPATVETPVCFKQLQLENPAIVQGTTAVVLHTAQATIEVIQGADEKTVEAVLRALTNVC